eukprot:gnl/Chilomastix_cuspidata/82.p4 GENE.gnl/Chilomastix_cuspidata/82~~gnl/Chilomastix_cuspidata/82.p4  ORF type:complete len:127 (-),score=54.29 gnl/Chilomastix_cuspidata/82:1765-2145(-)
MAPSKKTTKTTKKPTQTEEVKKAITKKRRADTYTTYIYRTLRQIHDLGISGRAMVIMNSLVTDIFDDIAREAANLARLKKRNTMAPSDIDAAVKLLFPGELAEHAISEGAKAVQKYALSQQSLEDE